MYFIQVMLTCRLRHELPDAIVQSAVNYQIRAVGGASALILDRRPFSKSCRSIKIDVIVVVHSGLQTLSHSLTGFADGGRENPFLASHQQFVPAKTRRQKGHKPSHRSALMTGPPKPGQPVHIHRDAAI